MKIASLLGTAVFASLLAAGAAGATTYTSIEDIGGATVDLSITTDGTLGVLSQDDITGYAIDVTDSLGSVDITPANSGIDITGSALTATATDLNFNFVTAGDNFALFEYGGVGNGGPFYCATTNSCFINDGGPAIGVATKQGEDLIDQSPETGVVTLASVSAAPEPASWTLLLVGVGLAGASLRRRRAPAAA